MGTISKNFSYREFEKSATADRYGIINNIISASVRDSIKALVLDVLQPLRDAYGRPMNVNSGFRCQELNSLVGGVASSQHTKGEAADIACDNPIELARLARDLNIPYDQLIVYPSFCHISHRLYGPQRHKILYNQSYKGERL